jgi:hypothetical protein
MSLGTSFSLIRKKRFVGTLAVASLLGVGVGVDTSDLEEHETSLHQEHALSIDHEPEGIDISSPDVGCRWPSRSRCRRCGSVRHVVVEGGRGLSNAYIARLSISPFFERYLQLQVLPN